MIDRADDTVSLCEVRFSTEPFAISKAYAEQLRTKLQRFREETGTPKALQLVLITSSGLQRNRHSDELVHRAFDAEQLFGLRG